MRCVTCRAEFVVAFRCKGSAFCPSCQTRSVALWSLWLDEQLLAAVRHRYVMPTVPKRLQVYFRYDRRQLRLLRLIADETLREYISTAIGEAGEVPSVVSQAQSFGSVAHWHPHPQLEVGNGAFRRDGRLVAVPAHEGAAHWAADRAAVLRMARDGARAGGRAAPT